MGRVMKGDMIIGGVEAGGTKTICAVSRDASAPLIRSEIPTTTPEETLASVCAFFERAFHEIGRAQAIGVASFGPVDISPESATFGRMLSTPKPGWGNANIVSYIESHIRVKTVLDTDVNCALLGEALYGAGRSERNLAYVTIGTGVGVGLMADGAIVYGESHPELGHVFAPKHAYDMAFKGVCDYHGDKCIEGLVSGPAIAARAGKSASEISRDDPIWPIAAHYISLLCMTIFLSVSPSKIILGGGVMQQPQLFPMTRKKFLDHLGGYLGARRDVSERKDFICPVGLGGDAGVIGAMALAARHAGKDSTDLIRSAN